MKGLTYEQMINMADTDIRGAMQCREIINNGLHPETKLKYTKMIEDEAAFASLWRNRALDLPVWEAC